MLHFQQLSYTKMTKTPNNTFYSFKYTGKISEYKSSAICYSFIKATSATAVPSNPNYSVIF